MFIKELFYTIYLRILEFAAKKLVENLDTDGDHKISAIEIKEALGENSLILFEKIRKIRK